MSRELKRCRSEGGNGEIIPSLLHHFTVLNKQKRCTSWGLIHLSTLTLTSFYTLAANSYMAILARGVFLKTPPIASLQPHSYIILTPKEKLPPPPLTTKREEFYGGDSTRDVLLRFYILRNLLLVLEF